MDLSPLSAFRTCPLNAEMREPPLLPSSVGSHWEERGAAPAPAQPREPRCTPQEDGPQGPLSG